MQQIKITTPEELLEREEISKGEYRYEFRGKKVLKFNSYNAAADFGRSFFSLYLMQTYGSEIAKKFPIMQTGPRSSDSDAMTSMLMEKPEGTTKECWLLVPENRYPEVEKFLNEKYLKEHQDIIIA